MKRMLQLALIALCATANVLADPQPVAAASTAGLATLAGSCEGCDSDIFGDYCSGGWRTGGSSCDDYYQMHYKNGELFWVTSDCSPSGSCGIYYTMDALDGSGRPGNGIGASETWESTPDGDIRRDCAGVVVGRRLTQQSASTLRTTLEHITL